MTIPIYISSASRSGRPATAGDFGALEARANSDLAAAGSQLSNVVGKVNRDVFSRIEDTENRRHLADATLELSNLQDSYLNDTKDFRDQAERFETKANELKSRMAKSLRRGSFGQSGGSYDKVFEGLVNAAKIKVNDSARARGIDYGRAQGMQSLKTYLGLAGAALDPAVRAKHVKDAAAETLLLVQQGLFSEQEAFTLREVWQADLAVLTERTEFAAVTQSTTDLIVNRYADPDQRMKAARSITNSLVRDEVVKRVKVRNQEESAAAIRYGKEQTALMWGAINQGGGALEIGFAGIPPKSLNEGLKFIAARDKADASGSVYIPVTDHDTYNQLEDWRENDTDTYKALNLDDYTTKLSPDVMKDQKALQKAMRKGDDRFLFNSPYSPEVKAFAFGFYAANNVTKLNVQKVRLFEAREAMARASVRKLAEGKRGELSFDEQKVLIRGSLMETAVPGRFWETGRFWDTDKRPADMTLQDRQDVLDNPKDELFEEAKAALLKKYGRPGTPDEVTNWIDNMMTVIGVRVPPRIPVVTDGEAL